MSDTPNYPRWHGLIMGDVGEGKSTFLATLPAPRLVLACEQITNLQAYLARGEPGPLTRMGLTGTSCEVRNKAGEVATLLETYVDPDPQRPTAFGELNARLRQLTQGAGGMPPPEPFPWASVIIETVTNIEVAAFHQAKYREAPGAKGEAQKQWHGFAMYQLRELLMSTAVALPCHVGVACHIDEDKDESSGQFFRNPKAPGQLRKTLGGAYGEVYRIWTDYASGTRYLQTQPGGGFKCKTGALVNAPDGLDNPTWERIWTNWKNRNSTTP